MSVPSCKGTPLQGCGRPWYRGYASLDLHNLEREREREREREFVKIQYEKENIGVYKETLFIDVMQN